MAFLKKKKGELQPSVMHYQNSLTDVPPVA